MGYDKRGLSLTAASGEAVRAFDHTIEGYLTMRQDTGDRLKATFAADPDMPMAHVLKAYFCMLMATGPLRAAARKAAAAGRARTESADARERLHIDAAEHWSAGRNSRALACWATILEDHPRDILAMRLSHHGYFYRGDGQNLRDGIARHLYAWDDSVPGHGYVLGMLAFGLEETHAFDAAMSMGRQAVERNIDPWAIHAVAHVHESRETPRDGIAWIGANADGWQSANGFRYHVWWHRILMHLDLGEYDTVFDLYDNSVWNPDSEEYLDLVNDAAVLLRLELHGLDVGDRWRALALKCGNHTTDQALAFIDVHYGIALAAAEREGANALLKAMRDYAAESGDDNAETTRAIGIPLVEAVMAHRTGDFGAVVDILMPIRYDISRMGGSHAQRDLFAMLLIDAALKSGRKNIAEMLLSERRIRMPKDAWTKGLAETAGLAA